MDYLQTFYALLVTVQSQTDNAQLQALRTLFSSVDIGLARADILICNVILPFAAAIRLIEHDPDLYALALHLYLVHPGLSTNRITRLMGQQLRLPALPQGSCQQQGLHYIYQQTCREKLCTRQDCIFRKGAYEG